MIETKYRKCTCGAALSIAVEKQDGKLTKIDFHNCYPLGQMQSNKQMSRLWDGLDKWPSLNVNCAICERRRAVTAFR